MDTVIAQLREKQDLATREVEAAAEFLLDEKANVEKKAELLESLSRKGETAGEIADFVTMFLEKAVKPVFSDWSFDGPTIDVCGTGGDKLDLFNVSTTSMFVVAAAGATVIKHGNRGITSQSGGADVLEALGVDIELSSEEVGHKLKEAGVGFLFAPQYHPAFRAVVPVRKMLAEKGVRTIFNLMGPLLNPAQPECQLVGVYDENWCPVFAEILQRLGRDSAWVVNGKTQEGKVVDEVSLMGPTRICKGGSFQGIEDEEISPEEFGFSLARVEQLSGGDARENAAILEAVLRGEETGPKAEMVALNAGAAIACAGLADHLEDGIVIAREILREGEGYRRLERLRS